MQVQAAVTPLFLTNKDVCVKACTGSGKTLAFVLPLIQTLLNQFPPSPQKVTANNEAKDDDSQDESDNDQS